MTAAILALDPAWTETGSSGVALIEKTREGRWLCRGVAPGYAEFVELARGTPVDWTRRRLTVGACEVAMLLDAASSLLGGALPTIIPIDMPVATVAITGRRTADRLVSQAFGSRGCGTHSPSALRPGLLGSQLLDALNLFGYDLVTAASQPASPTSQLIEVFQHPALLHLLERNYRVPYKVSKVRRYWPDASPSERTARLLSEWDQIENELRQRIDGIGGKLPRSNESTVALKRHEDALDALLAAWIAIEFLEHNARPFGDETAAIWIPPA